MGFMETGVKMVAILLVSPLIVLSTHIGMARIFCNLSNQVVAFKSVLFGYLPTALLLWFFVFRDISSVSALMTTVLYCFVVYSSLAYTYFHFFNMSETARRIHILYEIYRHNSLPVKDFTALYKTTDIIDIRLKRLVEMNQLEYSSGFYEIKGKILYFASRLVLLWRRILALNENSGKDGKIT